MSPAMDPHSHALLELPQMLERLAGRTTFPAGHALALALEPSGEVGEVRRRVAETEEAIRLTDRGVRGAGGAHDVRPAARAAGRGSVLEGAALEEVAATAVVALEAREAVAARAEVAPLLAEALGAVDVPALRHLEAALARALDGRGGLRDEASPELAAARRRLAAARRDAIDLLHDLARSLRSHLQEGFTTERGGRPVLAVKASSRSAVPGIVHDSSGSGQTIFVEPIALVEANNRVRERAAAEHEEEERLLRELSGRVGAAEGALADAVEALARLDLALAKGELSRAMSGCTVEEGDEVELAGVRHPLLDPARAVPIDLDLAGVRALVVSGPNTGGKTVAMKTLGLCALLHQCGLRVPARRARLPVFRPVLADIGDEQSIERSLSTFSGHVTRLIRIMQAAGPGSLCLLDEVAAGTDPEEGSRLARAVIERLVGAGATVLVTTHDAGVKAWASAAPGVRNAAVGIDARTLAPLYELRVGEPGASHALSIAERLGLDPDVIAAARAAVPPERRELESLLEEAAAARAAAEDARRAADEERGRLAAEAERTAARAGELEAQIARTRERAEAERVAARVRAEAELAAAARELADLRREIAAARRAEAARVREGRRGAADGGGGRERDRRLGAASLAAGRARAALAGGGTVVDGPPVAVGDEVQDREMGFRGRVVALDGSRAEVQGPTARLRLPVARLAVVSAARPASSRPAPREEPAVRLPPLEAASPEIDLRGMRVEGAREEVRAGIDRASMAGLARVRVIHGRGTGALRQVVREELRRHPLVDRVAAPPPEEGGDGATIAVLEAEAEPEGGV